MTCDCGATVPPKTKPGGPPKRFCSARCRKRVAMRKYRHPDGKPYTRAPAQHGVPLKERRASNNRRYFIKVRYGLTLREWYDLLDKQGRRCAICLIKPGLDNSRHWATDHNHKTGKVRGLLCNLCNVGLGNFKDDITLLEAAMRYLEETDEN